MMPATGARPYLYAVMGIGLLTTMDGVVKELLLSYPFVQAVFLRFAAGSLVAGVVLAVMRPPVPKGPSLRANLLRVPLVVLTASTFFYSVKTLPLSEAIALSFLSPVFVALFGILLLHEHVDRRIAVALVFGLGGTGVMLAPRLGAGIEAGMAVSGSTLGVAAALAAALFYALNLILLRRLAQNEHPAIIVAFQTAGPALVLAIPAWWVWRDVSAAHLWLCLLGGVLGVGGHLLLTKAFSMATAARVATTEYTGLVWASLIGFALFGEVPGLATWAGAALIICGAIIAGRR